MPSRSLAAAYLSLAGTLKPQKQGTCGLYSFWFATLLLNEINPSNPRMVYPRKSEVPGGKDVARSTGTVSLRTLSKGVGSGQGEVLTCAEMEMIISQSDYTCLAHIGDDGRDDFIKSSVAAGHPVLFPYIMGDRGPLSSIPVNGKPGVDYGPHWSLIIDEGANLYAYIEPNRPNKYQIRLKSLVLQSNAICDDYKYNRFWTKAEFTSSDTKPTLPERDLLTNKTNYYDIGDRSRQTLANVLVAVVGPKA